MIFYLGTHRPSWLARTPVPLFVSRRTLVGKKPRRKPYPRALGPWALDSGGFTELNKNGRWSVSPEQYVDEVRRFRAEIGNLQWAAPQDYMCEPFVLKKTGLSVREHQHLTVLSVLRLRELAPDLPWIPVLQGWTLKDYLRCVDLYTRGGVGLRDEPVVGLGSVCRRQSTQEASEIVHELSALKIRLHGFGFKTLGLLRVGSLLASSDSLAWSLDARFDRPLPECTGAHKACQNCLTYALRWREALLLRLSRHQARETAQLRLF